MGNAGSGESANGSEVDSPPRYNQPRHQSPTPQQQQSQLLQTQGAIALQPNSANKLYSSHQTEGRTSPTAYVARQQPPAVRQTRQPARSSVEVYSNSQSRSDLFKEATGYSTTSGRYATAADLSVTPAPPVASSSPLDSSSASQHWASLPAQLSRAAVSPLRTASPNSKEQAQNGGMSRPFTTPPAGYGSQGFATAPRPLEQTSSASFGNLSSSVTMLKPWERITTVPTAGASFAGATGTSCSSSAPVDRRDFAASPTSARYIDGQRAACQASGSCVKPPTSNFASQLRSLLGRQLALQCAFEPVFAASGGTTQRGVVNRDAFRHHVGAFMEQLGASSQVMRRWDLPPGAALSQEEAFRVFHNFLSFIAKDLEDTSPPAHVVRKAPLVRGGAGGDIPGTGGASPSRGCAAGYATPIPDSNPLLRPKFQETRQVSATTPVRKHSPVVRQGRPSDPELPSYRRLDQHSSRELTSMSISAPSPISPGLSATVSPPLGVSSPVSGGPNPASTESPRGKFRLLAETRQQSIDASPQLPLIAPAAGIPPKPLKFPADATNEELAKLLAESRLRIAKLKELFDREEAMVQKQAKVVNQARLDGSSDLIKAPPLPPELDPRSTAAGPPTWQGAEPKLSVTLQDVKEGYGEAKYLHNRIKELESKIDAQEDKVTMLTEVWQKRTGAVERNWGGSRSKVARGNE